MSENVPSENMPRLEKSPLRVKMAVQLSGLEIEEPIVEGVKNLS